jgi:uncharacterized protein YodC (DUF2158 family)
MDITKFEAGVIVKLKSGGPKMTCSGREGILTQEKEEVHCQWFAGSKMEDGWFPPDSLEIVKKSES